MLAYVQISLNGISEIDVYDQLALMDEVREVHIIYGEWDVIAKLEVDSPEALSAFMLDKIRPIQGVKLTSTMIVAK